VVAGLIILITLILNLTITKSSNRRHHRYFLCLLIAAAIPLFVNAEELINLLFAYTKLSVGLADGNRIEILNQYVGKIDAWTLLVGASYAGTVIDETYLAGNPHISYIRTHSFFGLPLAIIAMLSPTYVFFAKKTLRSKIVFSSFIGFAALRAASEPILFPTLLDFFYFIYFFIFFRYAPTQAKVHRASAWKTGNS
jgi:hypothetical protein